MEFEPPIPSRSTDELIKIANDTEDWQAEAIEQAKAELQKRNVSYREQSQKRYEWDRLSEKEQRIEMERRAQEGYPFYSLLMMSFKWPIALFQNWGLEKEGYLKMHQQRRRAIFFGMIAWAIMFYFIDIDSEQTQNDWQNEVNREDVYEWERSYYSDEELSQMRINSINEIIQTVRSNDRQNLTTYVICDGDTINHGNLTSLWDLDPLMIRNIIEEDIKQPEHYTRFTIQLVKPEK